jgi:hypothetical protein
MIGTTFPPKDHFVRAFWTCLQAHQVLTDFINAAWMGHTDMTGLTSEYMLKNRVHPSDLKRISDKMTTTQTQVNGLDKDLDGVERDVDQCLQKNGLTAKRGKRQRRS